MGLTSNIMAREGQGRTNGDKGGNGEWEGQGERWSIGVLTEVDFNCSSHTSQCY